MMRLFLNGLAASAGGGLTYLRNVIPELALRADVETTVLLGAAFRREFDSVANVTFLEEPDSRSAPRRFLREQKILPALLRRAGAQVLISAGNFALWNAPVPQILLSRNSLYTSVDFLRDVRARHDYAIWADTKLKALFARQSIRRADLTIAPSEAFARELAAWSGREVVALHHGFNAEAFESDPKPLPIVQGQLAEGQGALRLLFVSHYNYYRNFETLFRAIPLLKKVLPGRKVKLYLTCRLDSLENPGTYRAEHASSLVSELRADHDIVELGAIPYGSLHHLYRACDIYVTPAYAESFAHPLVEAMSSGLPVVASDLPVHREICDGAAVYFPRFSPEELADRILQLQADRASVSRLSEAGRARAKEFSWRTHVARLVERATEVAGGERTRNEVPEQARPGL
ncbi:MAG TPA: glycosyltransferase family 1 protein [Terriglobales bacterium]|nr:glycosyltransferase family 1 protein [Terriglobales bacterium]